MRILTFLRRMRARLRDRRANTKGGAVADAARRISILSVRRPVRRAPYSTGRGSPACRSAGDCRGSDRARSQSRECRFLRSCPHLSGSRNCRRSLGGASDISAASSVEAIYFNGILLVSVNWRGQLAACEGWECALKRGVLRGGPDGRSEAEEAALQAGTCSHSRGSSEALAQGPVAPSRPSGVLSLSQSGLIAHEPVI